MNSQRRSTLSVLIRPLTIEDTATSYHWRNDASLWEYTVNKPAETATQEREEQWLEARLKDPTERRFAIMADNTYVGNVHFTNITEESFVIHVLIGNKQYHKKGISPLAIYQLCYYGVHVLKKIRAFFRVSPENSTVLSIVRGFGLKEFSEEDGWISIQFPVSLFPNPACTVAVLLSHEDDLEPILQDILNQKCAFTFDILVGGQLSTSSRKTVQRYSATFPGKFAPVLTDGVFTGPVSVGAITEVALGDRVVWYEEALFRGNVHALTEAVSHNPTRSAEAENEADRAPVTSGTA